MKTRYQIYGLDAQGIVTHAGAHDVQKCPPTQATANRLQCEWVRWRNRYLKENLGDYPLRADALDRTRKTVKLIMEPLEAYQIPNQHVSWAFWV